MWSEFSDKILCLTDAFLTACIKIASLSGTFKMIPFPKNFRNAFIVHLNNGNTF